MSNPRTNPRQLSLFGDDDQPLEPTSITDVADAETHPQYTEDGDLTHPVIVKIKLASGQFVLIDECDADLAELKWCKIGWFSVYAGRRYKGKIVRLHLVILSRILGRELVDGEIVDHIDQDGFNNTRSNLRLANHTQNGANRLANKNNVSGFKGVNWKKSHRKWCATIGYKKKRIFLGYFDDPADAHAAYIAAARQYFGEFANDGNGAK